MGKSRGFRWWWMAGVVLVAGTAFAAAGEPGTDAEPSAAEAPPESDSGAPAAAPADLAGIQELIEARQYEEAERMANTLLETHPDDPGLLAVRGELLLALGRTDAAVDPLRRAAAATPERPRVHFQLGTALAAKGDTEGALEAFEKELARSSQTEVLVLARLNRSLLLQRLGKPAEAAVELEAALAVDASRAPIYGDLVALYLELDQTEKALAALARGAEAGFRSARHWFIVGAKLVKNEAFDRSLGPLRRALELDPAMAEAERTLGVALDRLGRGSEARAHFRRYVDLAPDSPDAQAVRARLAELEN